MIEIKDMPKIESPFVRKEINGIYVVTPEIAEGYEWVFNDDKVLATEKLHGTNVSILIQDGIITSVGIGMKEYLSLIKVRSILLKPS